MLDAIVGVLITAGALLVLIAGIGVIRFTDVYARMHAATKATTIGIALVGVAAAISLDEARAKILLAIVFIFITAPAAAHLVGRASYRAEGIDVDLGAGDDLAAMLDDLPERGDDGRADTTKPPA